MRNMPQSLVEIMKPNSNYRLIWVFITFLVIWYNAVMSPVQLFILVPSRTSKEINLIDSVLDIIFLLDTILMFFLPYIDKDTGLIVTNRRQIEKRYLRSVVFYLNILGCVPVLNTGLALVVRTSVNYVTIGLFNALRVIRIFRFQLLIDEIKAFCSRNGPINESVFRMAVILFCSQLIMCIFGSLYFGLSSASVADMCPGPDLFKENILGKEFWIASDEVILDVMDPNVCVSNPNDEPKCNDCPHDLFFLRSVYFLMQTLFTIGYGDSVVPTKKTAEVTVSCVFILFGVFGYGLIIANMTSVLSNIDVVNMRFRHEMDNIHKWLSFRSVPAELHQKVDMCFRYLEQSQYGVVDENLLDGLPNELAREVSKVNMTLLEKVPFFDPEFRTKGFILNTSLALIRRVYPPGTTILLEGENQRELIIVKKGRINLYVRACSDVVETLVEGDYFGDYQLLSGTVNEVGGLSVGFTEVLALPFRKFKEVLDSPSQKDIDFEILDVNILNSDDPGMRKTVQVSRIRMEKIACLATSLNKQTRSKKVRSMFEEYVRVKVKGFWIFPDSPLHVYWDVTAVTLIMFEAIALPIQMVSYFKSNLISGWWMLYIHYTIDVIFIGDMYLRMNAYAYSTFDGGKSEIIFDKNQIRKNYCSSSWYSIDRLAVVPFDFLYFAFGNLILLRIPKLIRVLQLPRIISRLRGNLSTCFDISMSEKMSSTVKMCLFSVLIIVWSSAGWNALRSEESGHKSVYWAITTLTTVGYGDITPVNAKQTIYAVIIGAIGATFTAGIIANVTSFFHDVDVSEDNIDHKAHCVMKFMESHCRPVEQVKILEEYFDYIEREQKGINEDLILRKALPDHLQTDVLIHLTSSMVRNCRYFSNCEASFLRHLMTSLEQQYFCSKSMILTTSLPCDGMYFIKKGTVDLLRISKAGEMKPFQRLGVDGYFAEESLVVNWDRNPYLAVSVTDCELWYLNRLVFQELVQDFPDHRLEIPNIPVSKSDGGRRDSIHALECGHVNIHEPSWFINPDNRFIVFWVGLVLIVILYSVISLPFRFAFMENHNTTHVWLSLDYTGDLILCADIVIRSNYLAYYDDNHLITNKQKIRKHYYHSGNMKWHIASILPLELAILYRPTLCPFGSLQVWSLFRMNKVCRLAEAPALVNSIESSLPNLGLRVPKNTIRVGKLIAVIIITAHFIACLFYLIASYNQYHTIEGSPRNWAYDDGLFLSPLLCPGNPVDSGNLTRRYIAAVYWSIATVTTVGYGDITAHEDSALEILFATFVLIIGTATYTLVIALLEDIVSQLDVTSSLHKMNTDKVHAYCEKEALPDNLKLKIDTYYQQIWQKQLGVSGEKIFAFIPASYRKQIVFDMVRPMIQKTYFLKDCTAHFIAHLVTFIKYELYLPGDFLFHEGERSSILFMLWKGTVDLLNSKGVKFKTAEKDSILGEASYFGFEPHICSAKATDTCEIFCLKMEDFIACLSSNKLGDKYHDYLLRNYSELIDLKGSTLKMIKNLKSSKMEKMVVEEKSKIPKGVILPESFARCLWDSLLFFQIVFLAFTVPYQISFLSNHVDLAWFLADVLIDMTFIFDIYAKLMKFSVLKDGEPVLSPNQFRAIYTSSTFRGDLVCSTPASFVSFCAGVRDARYGVLRVIQLIRIRHFGKYLSLFVENLNSRTKCSISAAHLRLIQIFFTVLFMSHWFACAFHLLGAMSKDQSWIAADESTNLGIGERYLRSFFWSLYTVTTVGYGSITLVTNQERIFAMAVMIFGAVICEAGITAILTSIISNRDQQSATNNRRIQCTDKFMSTGGVNDCTQRRVLDYYRYDDSDLGNLRENDILLDFSSSLREEVLRHFCYDAIRSNYISKDFSDGAVGSLVKMLEPYLAIPNEYLSVINEENDSVFVLKRGQMKCIDSSGTENFLPLGSLIGHMATLSTYIHTGLPSKVLEICLISGNGFKTKYNNPYIIFSLESTCFRSAVKKDKNWTEQILMKTASADVKNLLVTVRSWRNGQRHILIGSTEVQVNMDAVGQPHKIVIKDASGKSAGIIQLKLTFRNLRRHELLDTHERTTVAISYCHLYHIQRHKIEELKRYFDSSKCNDICERWCRQHQWHPLKKARLNECPNQNYLSTKIESASNPCIFPSQKTAINTSNQTNAQETCCKLQTKNNDGEPSKQLYRFRKHGSRIVPSLDKYDPEVGLKS